MDPDPPGPTDAAPNGPVASTSPAAVRTADHVAGSPRPVNAPSQRTPPLPQLVTELRDLVVSYVKQETVVPLKSLGRYVGFGVAGSLLLGFGVVFLGVSGLRALQTETGDTFTGNWSWVPYLIMVVALALGGALVWLLRTARRAEKGAR